jgi:probable phosphoglycerate mutase
MFSDAYWNELRGNGALTLLLVRHGQTEWNRGGKHLGSSDIGLDDVGRAQAEQLGRGLGHRVDCVYSSPLSRAQNTAAHIGAESIVLGGLAEMHQGALEGVGYADGFAQWPEFYAAFGRDPTHAVPPGQGETLGTCRDRMLAALATVVAAHAPGQVVAVVSHQLAIASALCTMEGSPLAQWRKFRLPNCGIRMVQHRGSTYRITPSHWAVGNLGIISGSPASDV